MSNFAVSYWQGLYNMAGYRGRMSKYKVRKSRTDPFYRISIEMPITYGLCDLLPVIVQSLRTEKVLQGHFLYPDGKRGFSELTPNLIGVNVTQSEAMTLTLELRGKYCSVKEELPTNDYLAPERIVTWNDALAEMRSDGRIVVPGDQMRMMAVTMTPDWALAKMRVMGGDISVLDNKVLSAVLGFKLRPRDMERTWSLVVDNMVVDNAFIGDDDNRILTTTFDLIQKEPEKKALKVCADHCSCGSDGFKEAGDFPAGRWWFECTACGKKK